ncbi:unnamed protein product [Cochlearia groenlandica]
MDSGNSSSMQSSSGGGGDQEEYDSRADQSISALFNHNNNTTTVSSNIAGPTQLDSLIANYFNTGWSTDTHLWSTTTTKPIDGSIPRPAQQPQAISSEQVLFTNQLQQNMTTTSSPIGFVPTDKRNGLLTTTQRTPKKRSRVSRRAPTTVLTTDTSNFRAMVQEFTGNPSTPFTGLSSFSSPFTRSRFDFFGSSSSSSSPHSRPFKPSPHKLSAQATTSHQHLNLTLPPSSTDYQKSLLLNTSTQNIANPFLNNQSLNNPLTDQSLLSEKAKPLYDQPLRLRTSNGFGHVALGTNYEGLHNIVVSSSLTQPNLNAINGRDNTNLEGENRNDMLRSINGEDQSKVQSEGMLELSWISSSD